jgi:uncharacterized protein YukE
MSEQVWEFGTIHAAIGALRGHSATIQAGNEQAEAALGKGVAAWSGEASQMWSNEQHTLNQQSHDFRNAVEQYLTTVEDATNHAAHTEMINAASFGG